MVRVEHFQIDAISDFVNLGAGVDPWTSASRIDRMSAAIASIIGATLAATAAASACSIPVTRGLERPAGRDSNS